MVVIALIILVVILPIIPKENCASLLGVKIACVTRHVSIVQLILGK